jgi:5-methylcytosine-specific restriction endonuclease McrA
MPVSKDSAAARGYGNVHRRLRLIVLERDGHRCRHCGAPATTADHYPIAKADGGPTTLDNLVAACTPCNSRSGAATRTRRARARRTHPIFVGPAPQWTPHSSRLSPPTRQGS